MTRRIIAFEVNGKFMISQELNGDKSEQQMFGLPQGNLNWSDVIKTFDGSKTTDDFVAAVHSVENAYHYQQIPLAVVDELPIVEQLWLLKDGSLQLAYEYGKPVFFYEAYFGNDKNEEDFVVVIKTHKELAPEDVTTIRPDLLETSGCEKCTKLVQVSYKFVEDFPDDAIVDCTEESSNVTEKAEDNLGTLLGKYQEWETKLSAFLTKSDYVEEFGWASDYNLYVWVYYIYLDDFVKELTEIVGNGLFDDGGIKAVMQDNCLCIDVDELLGSYINVEEIFPKDKFQH